MNSLVVRDAKDERDAKYAYKLDSLTISPPLDYVCDLSGEMVRVHQQGSNSCAANAATALLEHRIRQSGAPWDEWERSASFAYWAARQLSYPVSNGTQAALVGAGLRDCLNALKQVGAPRLTYWTDWAPSTTEPPTHCWHMTRRIKRYSSVLNESSWFQILLDNHTPIACTTYITTDWTEPDLCGDPNTATPAARSVLHEYNADPVIALHAIVLVGYGPLGWRIQGSCGTYWADGGYAWMPYSYPIGDPWAVVEVE